LGGEKMREEKYERNKRDRDLVAFTDTTISRRRCRRLEPVVAEYKAGHRTVAETEKKNLDDD
jgi:hypothetical protein